MYFVYIKIITCKNILKGCATAHTCTTKPIRNQTHRRLALLSHDSQDAGDALQSVCRLEVLAANFIPSGSRVWLCRTSPWPSLYVAVLNHSGSLHRCHFPLPGYSHQCTGHIQLPNSHANQPERQLDSNFHLYNAYLYGTLPYDFMVTP